MPTHDPPRPSPPSPRTYPRWTIALIAMALILHLNYWLWDHDGIVMGLPVNFLYHVLLSLLLSGVMLLLVRRAWPAYLDDEGPE